MVVRYVTLGPDGERVEGVVDGLRVSPYQGRL